MTTKYKIIVSFVVMTVIIGGVSVLGYVSLDTASSSFMEYRRLARLDVIASDIVAGQHQAAAAMRQFRLEPHKPEHMDAVVRILLDDRKLAEEALTIMQAPETIALGDSIKKGTDDQIGLDESYKVTMTDFMDLYNKTVQPNNRAVGAELAAVAEMSAEAGNVPALLTTALALKDLAWYRSAVSRFAFTRTPGDAKYTLELLDALNKAVAALSGSVVSEKGLVALAKLTTAMGAADKATRTMVDKGKEMDEVLASLVSLSRKVSKDGIDLNRQITVLRGRMGTETLQSNERGQKAMLAGSAVGMALAVLMSLAIVVGLVRVLRDTGGFADAVAAGRFDHQIKTREKGEIGGMIAAMRRIPEVLQTIVADYLDLEAKIKAGLLDSTGDAEKISGGFSTIIMGTNRIMGSYLRIIDNIPTPVLLLSREGRIEYLNGKARELTGPDYRGEPANQLFKPDDGGESLGLAMESGRPATAETRIHPRGAAMDVVYTAIPILNEDRSVASVLLLLTDLTAIREGQRTVRRVAGQAVTVADRVAAASEELSAQVEQVSRGAEMQRARVESTASAMAEMNSTVLDVARNAGQASEQSELTRAKAESGAGLVNKVVLSVNMVNRVAEALQVNMKDLGSQAESIGGVMNVISDIADQTNLLALNAAIEAARAGEAGRGFAVVADEVRKLAEKTMSATQEVGTSITAIQQSAHTNIAEVGEAAAAVSEATDLANASGRALGEIVSLATANSQVVASIATAAEEQSSTSEEINRSIEEISRVVGETTDGMVQSAAAVQELSRMAQELRQVMEALE